MPSPIQVTCLKTPSMLYVDDHYSAPPPPYETIDELMKTLQRQGAFIAIGQLGPKSHSEPPYKVPDKALVDKEIYGWKKDTFLKFSPCVPIIIHGARMTDTNAWVYFTLAQNVTKNKDSFIKAYQRHQEDSKIYAISYNHFVNRASVEVLPACPHTEWLYSVPVASLQEGTEEQETCRQYGQEIFDHYKIRANSDPEAGRNALFRIAEGALALTPDGVIRKDLIESAWEGVGDPYWQWYKNPLKLELAPESVPELEPF